MRALLLRTCALVALIGLVETAACVRPAGDGYVCTCFSKVSRVRCLASFCKSAPTDTASKAADEAVRSGGCADLATFRTEGSTCTCSESPGNDGC